MSELVHDHGSEEREGLACPEIVGCVAVEHLARYLVKTRRAVDAQLNDGCLPYPTWAEAKEPYRDGARTEARRILLGKPTP